LSSSELTLFVPALRAIGNIMTSDDPRVVERCIWNGAIDQLTPLLFQSNSNIVKEAIWALSNIAAGSSNQVSALVDSAAYDRIIVLTDNTNIDLRKKQSGLFVTQ